MMIRGTFLMMDATHLHMVITGLRIKGFKKNKLIIYSRMTTATTFCELCGFPSNTTDDCIGCKALEELEPLPVKEDFKDANVGYTLDILMKSMYA